MSSTSMTTTARQQMLNTFETFVRGELANICRKLNDLYPDGYFVSDAELEHLTWHLRQHFATMLPPVQDDAPEAVVITCRECKCVVTDDNVCKADIDNADDDKRCSDCTRSCDDCGAIESIDEMTEHQHRIGYVCNECSVECRDCSTSFTSADAEKICDEENADFDRYEFYCDSCGVTCRECNTRISRDDAHEFNDEYYCESCTSECSNCCDRFPTDELTPVGYDSAYCEDCVDGGREEERDNILRNAADNLKRKMEDLLDTIPAEPRYELRSDNVFNLLSPIFVSSDERNDKGHEMREWCEKLNRERRTWEGK